MNLTTKDLIKIIPFEQEFGRNLLEDFDSLSEGQKFNITQTLWLTYSALYQLKLEENLQLALMRARSGEEKIDKDSYKRVHQQTDQQMQSATVQNVAEKDLEAARVAMEKIVQEIQLANLPIKPQ